MFRFVVIAVLLFSGMCFGGEKLIKIDSDRLTLGQPEWFLMKDVTSGTRIAVFSHGNGVAAVILPEPTERME